MKFKRTERIGAIVKILSDNPNKILYIKPLYRINLMQQNQQ